MLKKVALIAVFLLLHHPWVYLDPSLEFESYDGTAEQEVDLCLSQINAMEDGEYYAKSFVTFIAETTVYPC